MRQCCLNNKYTERFTERPSKISANIDCTLRETYRCCAGAVTADIFNVHIRTRIVKLRGEKGLSRNPISSTVKGQINI